MTTERNDPRYNAPARLSDLMDDDRRKALVARDDAARRRYMAQYERPQPKRTLLGLFRGRSA